MSTIDLAEARRLRNAARINAARAAGRCKTCGHEPIAGSVSTDAAELRTREGTRLGASILVTEDFAVRFDGPTYTITWPIEKAREFAYKLLRQAGHAEQLRDAASGQGYTERALRKMGAWQLVENLAARDGLSSLAWLTSAPASSQRDLWWAIYWQQHGIRSYGSYTQIAQLFSTTPSKVRTQIKKMPVPAGRR